MLGRTNREYPSIWLRPHLGETEDLGPMMDALAEVDTVIDVTLMPGVLSRLHGKKLLYRGGTGIAGARTNNNAGDLMGAEIIEIVSSLAGQPLEFFVLRVREPLEDHQIEGALGALTSALEEGLVRHVALGFEGPAAMPLWQLNDAFDMVLVTRNHRDESDYLAASAQARSRRVGVVADRVIEWDYGVTFTRLPSLWRLPNLSKGFYGTSVEQAVAARFAVDGPVIVGVRTKDDVDRYRGLLEGKVEIPVGIDAYVEPFVKAWDDPAEWAELENSPHAWIREAAARRGR